MSSTRYRPAWQPPRSQRVSGQDGFCLRLGVGHDRHPRAADTHALGPNTTGHEIGGRTGVAILVTATMGVGGGAASLAAKTATGVSDAFLAAGADAGAASLIATLIMPSTASLVPKLRLAPCVAVH